MTNAFSARARFAFTYFFHSVFFSFFPSIIHIACEQLRWQLVEKVNHGRGYFLPRRYPLGIRCFSLFCELFFFLMSLTEWNLSELEGVSLGEDFILQHICGVHDSTESSSKKVKDDVFFSSEASSSQYSADGSFLPFEQQHSPKGTSSASISCSETFNVSLHTSVFQDVPQQKLIRICYEFVDCFLVKKWETLKLMDRSILQCLEVLNTVQEVLEDFMKKIELIQHELGDVREKLTSTTTHLENNRASEAVLWGVISQLLLPPEVVSLLTRASDERLGEQYKIGLRMLLRYLHSRRSTWREMVEEGKQLGTTATLPVDKAFHTTPSSPIQSKQHEEKALRELRFSFKNCKPYRDLVSVMDSVTVLACVKVKKFLFNQLQLLTAPFTNICIQQDHCLKKHKLFVSFLKNASGLLQHPPMGEVEGEGSTNDIPYQIASALYRELCSEYCSVLSGIFIEKIKTYLTECTITEVGASTLSKNSAILFASASSSGASSGFLFERDGSEKPATEPLSSGVAVNTIHFSVPPLSDMLAAVAGVGPWKLGNRGRSVFQNLFAGPIMPILEKMQLRKHPYEETVRSLFRLLCDVATHEYLFSFQFFSGDTAVFSDTLFPLMQLVMEFLSTLVRKFSPQQKGQFTQWARECNECRGSAGGVTTTGSDSSAAFAAEDSYGLLILIRLCHEFQHFMNAERHLPCLNGLFENVLRLLWPPFMYIFQTQRIAMRCVLPASLAACLVGPETPTVEKKMAFVHPLTQCASEYLRHLLSIILGTSNLKLARGACEEKRSLARDEKKENEQPHSSFHFSTSSLLSLPIKMSKDGRKKINWRSIQQQATAIMDDCGRGDSIPFSNEQVVSLLEEMVVLRREVVRHLEELALYILQGPRSSYSLSNQDVSLFKTAFVLNNIYYMYAKLYYTPIIQSASSPPMQSKKEGKNRSLHPTKKREFQGDEYLRNERERMREEEEREGGDVEIEGESMVGNRCNLEDVWNIYQTNRKQFVHSVLQKYLYEMWELAPEGNEVKTEREADHVAYTPLDAKRVRREAEHFASEWIRRLNGVRDSTRELVSDSTHQKEVMSQMCMEYLLLNTRFHAVVNKCAIEHPEEFKGVSLGNLLVSNQKLLVHMRTFTAFPVQ